MHLILILIILIILFGSRQAKDFLWLIAGLIFLLIAAPKNLIIFVFIIIVIAFFIICSKIAIEEDFGDDKENTIQNMSQTDNSVSSDVLKSERNYQIPSETESRDESNVDKISTLEDLVRAYGAPDTLNLIDKKTGYVIYYKLNLRITYNVETREIINIQNIINIENIIKKGDNL